MKKQSKRPKSKPSRHEPKIIYLDEAAVEALELATKRAGCSNRSEYCRHLFHSIGRQLAAEDAAKAAAKKEGEGHG